jgi:hypothetical protein
MYYPELPFKGNFDETKYKIYFADSGLLVAMLDEEAQEDLRANRNMGVYKGACIIPISELYKLSRCFSYSDREIT